MAKTPLLIIALLIAALFSTVVVATDAASAESKRTENLKEIVRPFYTQCLTVNTDTNVSELLGKLLADDFQSYGSVASQTKTKAQLIKRLQYFWKLIPNMKWEVQEMFQDGSTVIVRSKATGSPKGDFMGLPTDGTKSFNIMTIDIHTIENGQIVKVYHLEDWPTAMKQLKP